MADLSVLTDQDVALELGYARLREIALTKQLAALMPAENEPTRLEAYRAWKAAQGEGPPAA